MKLIFHPPGAATATATKDFSRDAGRRSLSPGERVGVRASVATHFLLAAAGPWAREFCPPS